MRAEFIIKDGWRQVEDCECGIPGFTYQTKQAKRLKLSWAKPGDRFLCPACIQEELQIRWLYQKWEQQNDEEAKAEILSRMADADHHD